MGKGSVRTPDVPDPKVVSAEQTKSNIATAQTQAQLNRVNQYTPYGDLVYSQNTAPVFDSEAYDKALADYNNLRVSIAAKGDKSPSAGYWTYGTDNNPGDVWNPYDPEKYAAEQAKEIGEAPTREQYTKPGSNDWSARINLSPAEQAKLDQSNAIQAQLGNMAQAGLGRVQEATGTPFDTSKLTAYQEAPKGGDISQQALNASGAGSFSNKDLGNYTTNVRSTPILDSYGNTDFSADRTNVENAIYSRLNPQLQRDQSALDVRLANQGIMQGSTAYDTAQQLQGQQANDARMQAILAGGQEQTRLANLAQNAGLFANNAQQQRYSQGLANAGLFNTARSNMFNEGMTSQSQANEALSQNNAAVAAQNAQAAALQQQQYNQALQSAQSAEQQRQQQIQEQEYLRNFPLNEINALLSGSQVSNPAFTNVPQVAVQPTDTSGNVYNSFKSGLMATSAKNAQNNAEWEQMMGVAKMFGSMAGGGAGGGGGGGGGGFYGGW